MVNELNYLEVVVEVYFLLFLTISVSQKKHNSMHSLHYRSTDILDIAPVNQNRLSVKLLLFHHLSV